MKDLIFESDYEKYAETLNLERSKFTKMRWIAAGGLAMLGLLIGIVVFFGLSHKMGISVGIPATLIFGLFGYKYYYIVVKQQYASHKARLALQFPEFLSDFISLLSAQPSGNVVVALEATIEYLPDPIKGQVQMLVKRIYDDASVENTYNAFQSFANYLGDKQAQQIVNLLFDMSQTGISPETLKDLEERIQKIQENAINTFVEHKSKRIRGRAAIPVLSVAIAFILVFTGVVGYYYVMQGMGAANQQSGLITTNKDLTK